MEKMCKAFCADVEEEEDISVTTKMQELSINRVGKINPKTHLEEHVTNAVTMNIVSSLATMLGSVVF